MSVLERVSLLNSYQTLLNDDSDFSRFESRLTNFGSGVLFSDMITKPEFNISGTSGTATITSGEAIITTTRATSSPITGKKTPVRYQLSDTKTLTSLVSGSKVYIEIDQTLVDNPTLIQDTYPSTDYANGLNIGTLTHSTARPTINTYIPLWELSGIDWTRTDLRAMPKIKGNRIDFVDVDGNISTEGNITAQNINALGDINVGGTITTDDIITPSGSVQDQIDQINIDIGTPQEFIDDSFMLGEPILAGQCAFLESGPTSASAMTKQNIGDIAGNTRVVSFPVIGTGVPSNTFKVNICKTGSTHPANQGLYFRIETDNAGSPSGTLVDSNAIAHIIPASLTTSLVDTTLTLAGSITIPEGQKCHLVAFQSTSDDYADTVIDTDYYNIGYSTNNTTTRPLNTYKTSWGTADNDKFPYISSDLFQDKLLSLTDATYAYKIDLKGIAIESKGIGTYPKLTIDGINGEQSELVADTDYYLNATPGSIGTSEGTNIRKVGTAVNATKLMINSTHSKLITIKTATFSTAYSFDSGAILATADAIITMDITTVGASSGGSCNLFIGATSSPATQIAEATYSVDSGQEKNRFVHGHIKKGRYYKYTISANANTTGGGYTIAIMEE